MTCMGVYGNARGIDNEKLYCFCLFVCSVFHVFPAFELCSVYCTHIVPDLCTVHTHVLKLAACFSFYFWQPCDGLV